MDYKIIAGGVTYISENDLREALGIVDEHADILGVVKKLKEERDELKEKCYKLKKRANAVYGASYGYSEYSASKQPAFHCSVISYSWNFGPIAAHSLMDEPSYPIRNDSIRVELDLTPTANYKGTFDLEDLKKYIQEYGREKKLGIVESVDYQNAKAARAELAYLYKTVLGKEKLDRDFSPHEIMKAILDEYKRVRDAVADNFNKAEDNVLPCYRDTCSNSKAIRERDAAKDALFELRAKIREIYRSVVDDEWDEHLSYTSAMNDINEEYKRVSKNFDATAYELEDTSKTLEELRKSFDNLSDLYNSACKLLGEYLTDAKDILGIDTCEKDTVISAMKALKAAYNNLRNDYDEVCEAYEKAECNTNYFREFEKACSERNEFISKLFDALELSHDGISCLYEDEEAAILKAIEDNREAYTKLEKDYEELGAAADADEMVKTLDQLIVDRERYKRRYENWYSRYESEHTRANGEHKRAEKCFGEIAALKTKVASLERSLMNATNEQVSIDAFRKKIRELQAEKARVIEALGQDIWDDCVN